MVPPGPARRLLECAVLALIGCVFGACDEDPAGDTPDTTAPAPVIDLTAAAVDDSSATLRWTATGDDGQQGSATSYDLRYATTLIATGGDFEAAAKVTAAPAPMVAGTQQEVVVPALTEKTLYYFAMRAIDERGNRSDISNVASATLPAGSFRFEVRVSDALGGPVAGVRVKLHVPIPGFQWAKPLPITGAQRRAATSIEFGIGMDSRVELTIFDLLDRPVRNLVDQLLPAGLHAVQFDGRNEEGIPFLGTAMFRCHFEAFDPVTGDSRYAEDMYPVLYTGDDVESRPVLGLTDGEGLVATSEITLFPGLLDPPPVQWVAGDGTALGTLALGNSVVVTLDDPGGSASQDVNYVVEPGLNRVHAVWMGAPPVSGVLANRRPDANRDMRFEVTARGGPVPIGNWDLRQNRPNPFH